MLPDWSNYGYLVTEELGRNREGGRITWRARRIESEQEIVIKQFCFAKSDSNWSAYKAQEREIQVLQNLDHVGIPRYLGSFETEDGFCLIQEHKNAVSLAHTRTFSPEEIKDIALKILEILIYLQGRIPPVIHRDIKPENILVDDQLNVYLIDFGLARIGESDVAASSVFVGTPGFIPPENIKKPTLASDLYSLGVTIICLLTAKKTGEIQDLTADDNPYHLEFKHLLPLLSQRFLNWLEKMVDTNQSKRYQTAKEALEALHPLDLVRVPEVKLSKNTIKLTADKLGQILTTGITVTNPIADTVLEGTWSVAPHPSDPPQTSNNHAWIKIGQKQFEGNQVRCQIQIDTQQLMADNVYQRSLILNTNGISESNNVTLIVKTATVPKIQYPPYLWLIGWAFLVAFLKALFTFNEQWIVVLFSAILGLVFGIIYKPVSGGFITSLGSTVGKFAGILFGLQFGLQFGGMIGWSIFGSVAGIIVGIIGAIFGVVFGWKIGNVLGDNFNGLIGILIVFVLFFAAFKFSIYNFALVSALIVGFTAGIFALYLLKNLWIQLKNRQFNLLFSAISLMLTTGFGIATGVLLRFGLNFNVILALATTSLPLGMMFRDAELKQARAIAKYHQENKQRLIRP